MKKLYWMNMILAMTLPTLSLAFSGGDGSAANPYQVSTRGHFESVTNNPAAHYILLNNIDFAGHEYSWGPIPVFNGVFDGGNYAITNMTVKATASKQACIFGTLQSGGVIRNLRFGGSNISYTEGTYTSPQRPVVYENYGAVSNCFVSGKLVGENRSGGLIIQCYAVDIPNGSDSGLIASFNSGIVRDSSAHNGQMSDSNSGEIFNCQTSGEVIARNSTFQSGGFVHFNYGLIKDSSTTACLTVPNAKTIAVGNFVGENNSRGRIENCSAAGIVRCVGRTILSGFGYRNYGELTGCIATVTLECTGNTVCGLVLANYGLIRDCQADIKISGYSDSSSGIAGSNYGLIFNSHNTGDGCTSGISGQNYGRIECCSSAGAENAEDLVGTQYSGILKNSFCMGGLNHSPSIAHGLVGQMRGGVVENCFSTGRLVGQVINPTNVQDVANYWDMEYSSGASSAMGTGQATAAMKTQNTFTDAGWDFEGVWMMSDPGSEHAGYPVLRPDQELKFTVTFVVGTNLSVRSGELIQTVPVDDAAVPPEVSGKPGWLFSGWDKAFDKVKSNLTVTARSEAWVGSGTPENPYRISTRLHLEAVHYEPDQNYVLENNIDLSGIVYGESVIRILNPGPTGQDFSGILDGKGYSIKNMVIEVPTADNDERFFALFEQVSGTIKNLSVVDCIVNAPGKSSSGGVGGMVGANFGVLSNCFTSGTVTGNCEYVGGLCAGNVGMIFDSSADVSVRGTGCFAGGLTGGNELGIIANSKASGDVTGKNYVGGLVGKSMSFQESGSRILNSFAEGSVSGTECAGGLAGTASFSTVTNCYATGTVTCSGVCGGLVGELSNSQLLNCYSIGRVNAQWVHSGLVGDSQAGGSAQESFWNIETSEHATSACGTGKTTEQMKTQLTYWDAGWDFINAWAMSASDSAFGGYPVLQWQVNAKHNVIFDAGENGSITDGESLQTVVEGSEAVAPTVTPDSGWIFYGWDKTVYCVFSNLTVNARYIQTDSFAGWLSGHGLNGDTAALFAQDRNGDSVPNGFEYAFGTNRPIGEPVLKIRRTADGRMVAEIPAQDGDTMPYVQVRLVGSTNLIDWTLPVEPTTNTTGKPANSAWYESEGVPPGKAFFKLEAELK